MSMKQTIYIQTTFDLEAWTFVERHLEVFFFFKVMHEIWGLAIMQARSATCWQERQPNNERTEADQVPLMRCSVH